MTKRVVGVYDDGKEALRVIEGLERDGFPRDSISVIAKDPEKVEDLDEDIASKAGDGLAAGAIGGGLIGSLGGLFAGVGALAIPGIGPLLAAGPIAGVLAGTAVGATAGGLVGVLVSMGISEEDALLYENEVKGGRILVLLDES